MCDPGGQVSGIIGHFKISGDTLTNTLFVQFTEVLAAWRSVPKHLIYLWIYARIETHHFLTGKFMSLTQ